MLAVTVTPALVAESVYVFVVPGVTNRLSLQPATTPTPLSIEQDAALLVLHRSRAGCPAVRCVASALKEPMVGGTITVNVCAPLAPPAVVIATSRAPTAAPTPVLKVAVSVVALVTLTLLT